MDLLTIAKTGVTIYSLSAEDLVSIFGRLEMTAAEESLRKASMAKDPTGSIYLAIGHLESAERASLQHVDVDKDVALHFFRLMSNAASFRAHEVRYHWFCLFYIYTAMATLYHMLGEGALANDAIRKLNDAGERAAAFITSVEWTPGHYLNPGNWRYLSKELPIQPEEVEAFIEISAGWD